MLIHELEDKRSRKWCSASALDDRLLIGIRCPLI